MLLMTYILWQHDFARSSGQLFGDIGSLGSVQNQCVRELHDFLVDLAVAKVVKEEFLACCMVVLVVERLDHKLSLGFASARKSNSNHDWTRCRIVGLLRPLTRRLCIVLEL